MKATKARYIRISSSSQNTIRQYRNQHPDEAIYVDVISGAVPFNERPEAAKLIAAIEAGTINYVSTEAIDRVGRNAFNIQSTINYFNTKGVTLKVENLGIESIIDGKPNGMFKMISDVLANVSELERTNSKERQAQGIKIAVANGLFKGRVKGTTTPDADVLAKYKPVVKELNLGVNSLRKIATLTGTSLSTVQRVKAILDKSNEAK